MTTKTLSRIAVLALVTAASVAPAHAFRMIQNTSVGRVSAGAAVSCNSAGGFAHWNIRNINWFLNTANQGSNKASAIQAALNVWTNVSSANHVLTYGGTTTAGFSTDGRNTVVFQTGNGCSGSCLAITALVLQSGQVIVETDVSFSNSRTWSTSGADFDTQAVAAHEFGHALGIHHTELSSSPRPTMYASYFGTDGRSLASDDNAALQCAESRY
ncbi:MAG TPA: matrixin family metalloprotease [Thermoanaerobaculia bacterium]|nr:matrixin family metalloprotease [Thermoanaerobaculia bacterium]